MSSKKFIISAIAILVLIVCMIATLCIKHNFSIETYSARIIQDSELINAEKSGVVTYIAAENNSPVTMGQYLVEISQNNAQNNCNKEELSEKEQSAVNEYEDAAISYKDGIITKEEYDESLDEYKNASEEILKGTSCKDSNNEPYKLYSPKDGIVVFNNIKEGSNIKQGALIATIKPTERRIKAYFSPKYSKKLENGMQAQITLIKYPERQFTGTIESVEKIEVNGVAVIIKINEDVSSLNINDNDNSIVRIVE